MKAAVDLNREYGIVLEGGGARGAYQIGAWKALREAGIKIRGVAGTSVGALNGALICMDDLKKAEEIWSTMAYSRVFHVEDDLMERLRKLEIRSFDFAELAAEVKKVVAGRGLDIGPLKQLIADTINEEKIRKSTCDFYATTFSLTDRKEINFDVKVAPEGTMKDMLLASAYFPGFKNEKLGGKTYMDGGSVNNVPVNVLTERGYKDIIVIRIYGIGVDKEKRFAPPLDVTIHRIAPRKNLGGILEFDSARAKRNMLLGYYDAGRLLYDLVGRKYYFYMPRSEAYYFDKMMSELSLFARYLLPGKEPKELLGYRAYTEGIFPALAKKMRLPAQWNYRDFYGVVLEICARKLELEVFHIYTVEEIMEKVHRALAQPCIL